jgi:DNA recombination protein RmuC
MEILLGLAALVAAAIAAALYGMLARARADAANSAGRARDLEAQAGVLDTRLVAALEARLQAERDLATARERGAAAENRQADFERLRQESLNQAKAAVFETAQKLSKDLIEDHRRESAEARLDLDNRTQQASTSLLQQVGVIAETLGALKGQVEEKSKTIDTLVRVMSSPGGAGQIAEIGLANTLKGMGLEEGRDYLLQASTTDEITGKRLRPDAIVVLPGNRVIIIDCKSSKFLLEIGEAQSGEREDHAYARFAETMNGHLKALATKDYGGAVQAAWREAGRGGEIAQLISIMYLPHETALEKLGRADPAFFAAARREGIIPAGPAALHGIISFAAQAINTERQVENQQRILDAAKALVDGIGIALRHAGAVGMSIRNAADAFEDFTKSVNARLLPRAKRLAPMGVPLPTGKSTLPQNLPAFTVHTIEAERLIEGEAAELSDEPPLPRLLAGE